MLRRMRCKDATGGSMISLSADLHREFAAITCEGCRLAVPLDLITRWPGAPRQHNGYGKDLRWHVMDCTSRAFSIAALIERQPK